MAMGLKEAGNESGRKSSEERTDREREQDRCRKEGRKNQERSIQRGCGQGQYRPFEKQHQLVLPPNPHPLPHLYNT
jgi:hypothetical protein